MEVDQELKNQLDRFVIKNFVQFCFSIIFYQTENIFEYIYEQIKYSLEILIFL